MNQSPPKKAKAQLTPGFQKSGLPSQLINKNKHIGGHAHYPQSLDDISVNPP